MNKVPATIISDSPALVKRRIQHLLETTRLTHQVLWEAAGMTESGYFKILRNGTMDVRTLTAIAARLGVEPSQLLADPPAEPTSSHVADPAAPYARPRYIEERMSDLETEVRKLKERLRDR